MDPMPPPTMPPPCTKGPSLPAMIPAAMENTTPISFRHQRPHLATA